MTEDVEAKLNSIGSEDVQADLKALIANCKEKLGIPAKEIMAAFDNALKRTSSELDENERAVRAFIAVKGPYNAQLKSPAKTYEGIVLGCSDAFDMLGKMRNVALELYHTNPEKAIEGGLVNTDGVPLDTRQTFVSSGKANSGFGKPLAAHAYIKNAFGKYREKDSGDPWKIFKMALGDQHHAVEVPTMKFVSWRGNIAGDQPDPNVTKMNPYAHIQFTVLDFPEGMNADSFIVNENEDPLDDVGAMACQLGDVPKWHQDHASDMQRVLITVADVTHIGNEPNPTTGNLMLVLEDASLPEDRESIVAWVPEPLIPEIDFGSGSRCYIIAGTSETMRGDPPAPDWLLNVHGIYPIPRYRMEPEEAPQNVMSRPVK